MASSHDSAGTSARTDFQTTTSRRRLLAGLAAAPVALALPGIALAAPHDPAIALVDEWMSIEAIFDRGPVGDDESDKLHDRAMPVWQKLTDTRAESVDGLKAKIRALGKWYGVESKLGPGDMGEEMILSLLKDVRALTGGAA